MGFAAAQPIPQVCQGESPEYNQALGKTAGRKPGERGCRNGIATEHLESIVLVSIKGRFYSSDAQRVEDGLAAALGGGAPHLAVNMTELDYISSAGLRVLLKLAKKIQRAKGKVVLFGLRPNIREVFSISAFDRIFSIHNDRAAAVAAMQ
jgi:stage II sporulation protein AA (anti-sigma F factor antagonist)